MQVFFRLVLILTVGGTFMVSSHLGEAGEINSPQKQIATSNPFVQFSKYDPNSRIVLDHSIWSEVLRKLVWKTGMSDRIFLGKERLPTGTNISYGNSSPYRLEGNKIFFHNITHRNLKYLDGIKRAYEALPNKIPLETLHRNEQLAYWLNLHNIKVLSEIAKAYPITDIRKLEKRGVWRDRSLTVQGVALSLDDIQSKILIKNWPTPMIMYGLYQGAGGGPNLQNKAFTGENISYLLRQNAHEFVNANRGVHFRGDTVRISILYEKYEALFPNGQGDLKRHLMEFADPIRVMPKLARLDDFEATVYDHNIADLYNGQLGAGPGSSKGTNPAALLAAGNTPEYFDFINSKRGAPNKYPYHVKRLLTRMDTRNLRRARRGIVTIDEIEVAPEPPPIEKPKDKSN